MVVSSMDGTAPHGITTRLFAAVAAFQISGRRDIVQFVDKFAAQHGKNGPFGIGNEICGPARTGQAHLGFVIVADDRCIEIPEFINLGHAEEADIHKSPIGHGESGKQVRLHRRIL